MLKTIQIDWDIHKLIELERQGFDEPEFHALRRLLGLPELATKGPISETPKTSLFGSDGAAWSEDGVVLPHGTLARMEYDRGKQVYEGAFLNGCLVVGNRKFDSLSPAARELATTKAGGKTQLNGWLYWMAKLPGENDWMKLNELRSAVRSRR